MVLYHTCEKELSEAQAHYVCSGVVSKSSPSTSYDIDLCVCRPVPLDLWIRLPNITSDLPGNP